MSNHPPMKFRLAWEPHTRMWRLQTPPLVRSQWHTIATHKWRWPLRIQAWALATLDRHHRAQDQRNQTEEISY